ncbi:flagellar basal-body rod modification protein FlgD [Endobacter medicaginis]|jgi:flagellar basal-body rod modification protein FlgD|uniref:Basal-body rod modification protein FlgD n=1 Tax=Endobacter medicaginis TaxID=1181271 RepID=A0A839V2P6_9PROT|nr:flagellar hook capping FlgD N-terminal domain-containing protein [Endobacter medicaginis]MBB3174774.1 flagellar basal-body rod modification protein FlgD [Endobacter medicaginis]MCX5475834.1 flagellar biosynthesis protein FlgD [Endobacter medicaginis]NVN29860.1 flagellar biosynthesis protein FlgD [Endobacter medicaginis]
MSQSTLSTNSLTQAAIASARTAATTAASADTSATAASSSSALSSLTSNFNTFLTLLTTQLQNQDPTSPMSSDSFTSELAQFAGVEQQVKTNTNLTQLITAGQSSTLTSAQSLIGDTVSVSGSQFALQNSAATLQFSTTGAEPVAIAITDSSGNVIRTEQVNATKGANTWTWDGTSDDGVAEPDGTYTAALVAQGSGTSTTPLTFGSTAKVTGITRATDGSTQAQFGSATIPLSSVSTITTKSTS